VEPSKRTVGSYLLEEWLPDNQPPRLRPSSYANYTIYARTHVVPRLGDIELQRLTPSNLSGFYRALLTDARRDGQGLAPKTVRNIHAMLHRALKDAVRLGYLVRNVADAVTPPRGASPEMQVWTPQQLRAFLAHARHDRLYALWLRLGHATIAITLDVYSHVIPGMDAQAANAVASLILDGSSPSEGPGPKPGPSTDK
jgi:hypothetical protein